MHNVVTFNGEILKISGCEVDETTVAYVFLIFETLMYILD